MTRIKICGNTTLEDAIVCVEAGADALGFIFVEGTPRFVTPALAGEIIRDLPPFVNAVGVFWDHPPGHVKAVAEACGLSALQFHGVEPPEMLARYSLPVIKAIKVGGEPGLDRVDSYSAVVSCKLSGDRLGRKELLEGLVQELVVGPTADPLELVQDP
jgi:phosphoribosylanthranilate isomerase